MGLVLKSEDCVELQLSRREELERIKMEAKTKFSKLGLDYFCIKGFE